ncbi:unnamed protein product [Vitrella brassicaformis CCMP3155]|uniref:Uncharacterized protein n=1 Tax=Vitrella brassicaformis (strain CCMP3155) TaxID=1169540 RepID=A0A0G4EYB6_VITBC|nr:unnamed protein product [Vitrella brassicaformis CCMP3155]|eukprot:CEM03629.1 unnamed protein product [Vitrella brassicaformis CCMP3155]
MRPIFKSRGISSLGALPPLPQNCRYGVISGGQFPASGSHLTLDVSTSEIDVSTSEIRHDLYGCVKIFNEDGSCEALRSLEWPLPELSHFADIPEQRRPAAVRRVIRHIVLLLNLATHCGPVQALTQQEKVPAEGFVQLPTGKLRVVYVLNGEPRVFEDDLTQYVELQTHGKNAGDMAEVVLNLDALDPAVKKRHVIIVEVHATVYDIPGLPPHAVSFVGEVEGVKKFSLTGEGLNLHVYADDHLNGLTITSPHNRLLTHQPGMLTVKTRQHRLRVERARTAGARRHTAVSHVGKGDEAERRSSSLLKDMDEVQSSHRDPSPTASQRDPLNYLALRRKDKPLMGKKESALTSPMHSRNKQHPHSDSGGRLPLSPLGGGLTVARREERGQYYRTLTPDPRPDGPSSMDHRPPAAVRSPGAVSSRVAFGEKNGNRDGRGDALLGTPPATGPTTTGEYGSGKPKAPATGPGARVRPLATSREADMTGESGGSSEGLQSRSPTAEEPSQEAVPVPPMVAQRPSDAVDATSFQSLLGLIPTAGPSAAPLTAAGGIGGGLGGGLCGGQRLGDSTTRTVVKAAPPKAAPPKATTTNSARHPLPTSSGTVPPAQEQPFPDSHSPPSRSCTSSSSPSSPEQPPPKVTDGATAAEGSSEEGPPQQQQQQGTYQPPFEINQKVKIAGVTGPCGVRLNRMTVQVKNIKTDAQGRGSGVDTYHQTAPVDPRKTPHPRGPRFAADQQRPQTARVTNTLTHTDTHNRVRALRGACGVFWKLAT